MSNPQQQNSDQDQDQDSSALFLTDHSNNRQPSLQEITLIDDRVNDEEEMHETHDLEDDDEQDDDDDDDSHDYYDPHGDIARYHEQRLEIEESWLEWERQAQANNRQNYIFQKPGSAKRRDRRERYAQLQMHRQGSPSPSSSASGSASGPASVQGLDPESESSAAIEKLRRLGSYRPALASSIVHSYSNLSWEAVQAAREKRLAAKAISSGSG